MNGRAVRIAGITGVVVLAIAYWHQMNGTTWQSLLAAILAVLTLVSPEAVDAFPLGPSK